MGDSSWDAVAGRIARFEGEGRRQVRIVAALVAGATILLLAQACLFQGRREVQAENYKVTGPDGRSRATFGMGLGESPALALLDDRGRDLAVFCVFDGGSSALHFYNEGQVRVGLSNTPGGPALLRFFGHGRRSEAGLTLQSDGTVGLGLTRDRAGLAMTTRPDGATALAIRDADGREVRRLGVGPDKSSDDEPAGRPAGPPPPRAVPTRRDADGGPVTRPAGSLSSGRSGAYGVGGAARRPRPTIEGLA